MFHMKKYTCRSQIQEQFFLFLFVFFFFCGNIIDSVRTTC